MANLWFNDPEKLIDLTNPETYKEFNLLVTPDYSDPNTGHEIRGIRPPISNNEQQTKNKTENH